VPKPTQAYEPKLIFNSGIYEVIDRQ